MACLNKAVAGNEDSQKMKVNAKETNGCRELKHPTITAEAARKKAKDGSHSRWERLMTKGA
jgi:hypothetical protein